MEYVILFAVFVAGVYYAARPLFDKSVSLSSDVITEIDALNMQKLDIYSQIKQFDMEFELDLLSESDYNSSRDKLKLEAAAIIDKIKALRTEN